MGATLTTRVSQAMNTMKAFGDHSVFHDSTVVAVSRKVVANGLHGRMQARVSAHLDDYRRRGIADRRNGGYTRRILHATEFSAGLGPPHPPPRARRASATR